MSFDLTRTPVKFFIAINFILAPSFASFPAEENPPSEPIAIENFLTLSVAENSKTEFKRGDSVDFQLILKNISDRDLWIVYLDPLQRYTGIKTTATKELVFYPDFDVKLGVSHSAGLIIVKLMPQQSETIYTVGGDVYIERRPQSVLPPGYYISRGRLNSFDATAGEYWIEYTIADIMMSFSPINEKDVWTTPKDWQGRLRSLPVKIRIVD